MRATVGADGVLRMGAHRFRGALGRGGIAADKREGDGATPAGVLALRRMLYRADRVAPPVTRLAREPIGPGDGWCDDPAAREYNRFVTLPHPARCERLWRDDGLYDVVIPLGWNDAPVERGRGSAIFLHVASADLAPTEGCIALTLPDLLVLLREGCSDIEVAR